MVKRRKEWRKERKNEKCIINKRKLTNNKSNWKKSYKKKKESDRQKVNRRKKERKKEGKKERKDLMRVNKNTSRMKIFI